MLKANLGSRQTGREDEQDKCAGCLQESLPDAELEDTLTPQGEHFLLVFGSDGQIFQFDTDLLIARESHQRPSRIAAAEVIDDQSVVESVP